MPSFWYSCSSSVAIVCTKPGAAAVGPPLVALRLLGGAAFFATSLPGPDNASENCVQPRDETTESVSPAAPRIYVLASL